MNDITYAKLKTQLSDYCISKSKEMTANKKYSSPTSFKSDIVNYYKDILDKNENNLTEEQYSSLKAYFESYTENFITQYSKNVVINTDTSTGYGLTSSLDTDPTVSNGFTYYNGKKLGVFSGYTGTNSTYSMCDMVATIQLETDYGTVYSALGELQTISYSIHQQKEPVRCLGNMNAKDWVFGPRTIAGSLVFAVFNKHWMISLYDQIKEKAGMKNWHFVADEIPPFNITMTFANEYGFDSRMVLYGVRLMNEGQVMSTNDIYIENTYEFVANDIEIMDSLNAYQSNTSTHQRGQIVDSTPSTTITEEEKTTTITPTGKEGVTKEVAQATRKFTEAELYIDDSTLAKMDKKSALSTLKDVYNAWMKEPSTNSTEIKNQIKSEYKKQKERIETYYKNKEKEAKK